MKTKGILRCIVFMFVLSVAVSFATPVQGCDMVAIFCKSTPLIADIPITAGAYNDPMDFWNQFVNVFRPSNPNGYGIIYYGINDGDFRHIWEYALAHPDNQVFRSQDSFSQVASNNARLRIFNQDGLDHNAFLVIAHARYASGGNNNIPDPHPFVWDYPNGENTDESISYTFAHNGTVDKVKLRHMTEELWASWHPGEVWSNIYPYKTEAIGNNELVDSEAYFHFLVCNIKLAGTVEEGIRRSLIAMKDWNQYRNFIFADAQNLYLFKGLTSSPYEHYLGYVNNADFFGVLTGGTGTQVGNNDMVRFYFPGGTITNYNEINQPRYASIPYNNTFEYSSWAINSYWYLNSWDRGNDFGRIRVREDGGNRYMLMDSNTNLEYVQNEAMLYLNIANTDRLRLKFSWRSFSEEDHDVEGVYFSDDGGNNFVQVYDFELPGTQQFEEVNLDVDSLCSLHGLDRTATFVVKFVQYDNYTANSDGIAIDDIHVYEAFADPDNYSTGFESGELDEFWESSGFQNNGRVQVTSNYTPCSGSYHLTMDSDTQGQYALNNADLYVDFSQGGHSNYTLTFSVKDYGDENNAQDGIYFSDDYGQSFTLVYQLTPQSWTNQECQTIELDINQLADQNNLELTNRFIIRFQQYDNYPITTDGMAFDEIDFTGSGDIHPGYD